MLKRDRVGEKMKQVDIWNKRFQESNKVRNDNQMWIEKYWQFFEEEKDNEILDLGCGRGQNALYLCDKGLKVTACDFSPAAIDILKKIGKGINTYCLDMTEGLPFGNDNFGIVLASLSTHYFAESDTKILYSAIYDILKPDGYFIFKVNSYKEYLNKDISELQCEIESNYYMLKDGTTKRYFTADSLASMLEQFTIIQIEEDSSMYHGVTKYSIEGIVQKTYPQNI